MKKIAVHDGKFHADEIFAIAILKIIYPKLKIIRTRNPKIFQKADMRIDIGNKYNPLTNDYDHHQPEFKNKRKNKIPYASAGLIWKKFGKKLTNSKESFNFIDSKIIQYIDAEDNGFEEIKGYSINKFIEGFNSLNLNKKKDEKSFNELVAIIQKVLENEIAKIEFAIKSKKIIRKKIKETNKDYIILEKYIPWKEITTKESKLKFVICFNDYEKKWHAIAVPKKENKFKNRKDFPKKWAGLTNKKLIEISGVADATFCHKNLFIAIAKSKKGAINLVEKALTN
jgi:uncharacterized UPF0160 family protein